MVGFEKESDDVKKQNLRTLAGQRAMKFLPIPFTMLSLGAIWLINPKKDAKTWVYKFKLVILGIYVINMALEMTSMVVDLVNNNFSVDDFGIYTCSFNCLVKAVIIAMKGASLTTIVLVAYDEKWTTPRNPEEKNIIGYGSRECRAVHRGFMIANSISLFLYCYSPLFYFLRGKFELPAKIWYPYSLDNPVYFWASYAQAAILLTFDMFFQFATELLYIGLLIQLRTQLQLLNYRLKNFTETKEFKESSKHAAPSRQNVEIVTFRNLMKDQQDIYRLAELINKFASLFLTIDVMIAAPNICINLYVISSTSAISEVALKIMILLYVLLLFFLQCWYANNCYFESTKIPLGFYEMNWLNVSPVLKKLIIIAMSSSKPIEFNVAKILPLNLTIFGKVLKSSYSSFNVLRNTNNQ